MRAQETLIFAAFKGVAHLDDIHTDDGRERLLNGLVKAAADLRKLDSEAYLLKKVELAQISIEGLIAAHGNVENIIANDVPPPRLAAWEVTESPSGYPLLQGIAFGHPRLTGFARPIVTSLLLYIDTSQGYARTLSRWYRLLKPQPSVYDA